MLAAEHDDPYAEHLRIAIEQSRLEAESADAQKAIQASLKKHASPVQARHDLDDEEMQAALALSLATQQTIEFIKYIKACRAPQYDALFTQLDKNAWDAILRKLETPGKRAQTVVLLLGRVKNELSKDPDASRLLTSIDDALLRIFSGCWGFSKIKPDGAVMTQLKQAAKGIGYRAAELRVNDVVRRLEEHFKSERKWEGATDLNVRKHFMALYGYVASGYLEQKFHAKVEAGSRDVYKNDFARFARSFFQKIDIEGIALDDLVTDPEKAFRERKAVVKAGVKLIAFEWLADFIRREVAPEEIENLQQYLKTFDSGSPEITENKGLLKLFQKALQQIPIRMEEALTDLQREGSLEPTVNIKELAVLLSEAVMYTAIPKDVVYDKAIAAAKKANRDATGQADDLNSLYNFLMQYVRFVDEENKIKGPPVFVVAYPGKISGVDVDAGKVLLAGEVQAISDQAQAKTHCSDIEQEVAEKYQGGIGVTAKLIFTRPNNSLVHVTGDQHLDVMVPLAWNPKLQEIGDTLARYPLFRLDDTVAGVEQVALPTGAIKDAKYKVADPSDLPKWISNNGRALDYLIKNRLLSRDLKLSVLLMLNNGMID